MEKRRLGRTGHFSTVLTLGGAALGAVAQSEADAAVALASVSEFQPISVPG